MVWNWFYCHVTDPALGKDREVFPLWDLILGPWLGFGMSLARCASLGREGTWPGKLV